MTPAEAAAPALRQGADQSRPMPARSLCAILLGPRLIHKSVNAKLLPVGLPALELVNDPLQAASRAGAALVVRCQGLEVAAELLPGALREEQKVR